MRSGIFLLALLAVAVAAPSENSNVEKKPRSTLPFDRYWTLDEIYDYMTELEAEFPLIAKVEQMGRSFEGREIRGLRVTNEEHLGQETLPIFFVTAGTRGRDWISVMIAVNIMHELVEHYEDFQHIVDDVEWFILPVANPDGFVFTSTEGNRGWIKNRVENEGSDCPGVNIDRNFDFNFGLPIGSGRDPCSQSFFGPFADSEEETKTIQFAVDIFSRIQRGYITIRAGLPGADTTIAYPFSSNNELFQPNWRERIAVGNIMANAIFRNTGRSYRVASEANVNNLASGTSTDYAAGRDNVPLAYTIFSRAAGPNGWDVAEEDILEIVNEIFFAIEAVGLYTADMPLPSN